MKPPIRITISTFVGESDEPVSERTIDHAVGLDRRWLESHLFWAIRNRHAVHIEPEKEAK